MSLLEKLQKIQTELKAPKNQYNSFGGYNYRNCEDILEALKPLLEKYKCVLTLSDEAMTVGERYYIRASVQITDCEGDGATGAMAWAREAENKKGMDEAQITGSTSSYARKYALNGLFAIDDEKDPDTRGNKPEIGSVKTEKKLTGLATEKQKKMILSMAKDRGVEAEDAMVGVKTMYKLESWNDLTKEQASSIIDKYLKKQEKQEAEEITEEMLQGALG